MLRSHSDRLGDRGISPEGEKRRLRWEGFVVKESSKPGVKERGSYG